MPHSQEELQAMIKERIAIAQKHDFGGGDEFQTTKPIEYEKLIKQLNEGSIAQPVQPQQS